MLAMILAAALAATPSEPYAVVRPGDSQMSCPALLAEINALSAETARRQQVVAAQLAAAGMRPGMATADTAMGMLTGMLPFGGGLIQSAAADAQNAATMNQIKSASDAMAGDLPKYDRIQRLTDLSDRHHC